jgi:hypothetical protein
MEFPDALLERRRHMGNWTLRVYLLVFGVLLVPVIAHSQVEVLVDTHFDASVARPHYLKSHPVVLFDEAHSNYHTAAGRYEPLARLLRNDGYTVVPGKSAFLRKMLRGVSVLLVANARGEGSSDAVSRAAFTEAECTEVSVWVRFGGSLLLIADHTPFGSAAANLSSQFGVEMGNSYVFDSANSTVDDPTILVFSNANGLLGDHIIMQGFIPSETVTRVVAFTGQSLSIPPGATALMKLSATAYEAPTRQDLDEAEKAADESPPDIAGIVAHAKPVAGRAQGVALSYGKGRVVIVGEAAMFSAQILSGEQGHEDEKFGMNTPGNDDKRFALNVLHWLSGAERKKK